MLSGLPGSEHSPLEEGGCFEGPFLVPNAKESGSSTTSNGTDCTDDDLSEEAVGYSRVGVCSDGGEGADDCARPAYSIDWSEDAVHD